MKKSANVCEYKVGISTISVFVKMLNVKYQNEHAIIQRYFKISIKLGWFVNSFMMVVYGIFFSKFS